MKHEVGSRVYEILNIGRDIKKERYGVVKAATMRGAEVLFDGERHANWIPANRLRPEAPPAPPTKHAKAKPAPTPVTQPAPTPVTQPATPAPTATEPTPEMKLPQSPDNTNNKLDISVMKARGLDPMAMWLELGQALKEQHQTEVADAEAEVAEARDTVKYAEEMLVEARGKLAKAVQRLDVVKLAVLKLSQSAP